MVAFTDMVISGVFHAAVLFLVAAGLQLVFGVQKIVNLASGSFYALGAYFGISIVAWGLKGGLPPWSFLLILVVGGLLLAAIGPPIELVLRTMYRRDESFQLLLTFAMVLMFQDVLRFFWGPNTHEMGTLYLAYGKLSLLGTSWPTYYFMVIAASLLIALGLALFLRRTRTGRILIATAENRAMAEALGVNVNWIYACVFTLGTALGTIGGALVVPTTAASLDMALEVIVESFAVVVIGGLGSMWGALVGALIVGLIRAGAIAYFPEVEVLAIYLLVVIVLIVRPAGLFGKATA